MKTYTRDSSTLHEAFTGLGMKYVGYDLWVNADKTLSVYHGSFDTFYINYCKHGRLMGERIAHSLLEAVYIISSNPPLRNAVLRDAMNFSLTTLVDLTGFNTADELGKTHDAFVAFVVAHEGFFSNWRDAWDAFVETDSFINIGCRHC